MKTMMRAALGAALVACAGAASGEVILVDFGASGTGNPGDTASGVNGENWNNFNPGSFLNLVDTGGGMSGLTLAATTGVAAGNNGGLTAPQESLLGDLAVASATQDYLFTTSSMSFVIGGLQAGLTYNLDFFGTRATGGTRVTAYDVAAGNGMFQSLLQTSGTDIGADGMYDGNDDTLAMVDGLTADANGEIAFTVSVSQGGFAYLGAMRIEVIPAPSSAMAMLGLAGLAPRRRR